MVMTWWRAKLNSEMFALRHHRPEDFVRCQWQRRPSVHPVYLCYRWLLAGFFLVSILCSILDVGRNLDTDMPYFKWPIFLTNWGYTACTLQALLGAWLVTRRLAKERSGGGMQPVKMSVAHKAYWALHTTAVVTAIGITAAYWITVYDPALHVLDTINIMVHAGNSVLMLTDLFLVSHPFRLQHCYWPLLLSSSYVMFSLMYYQAGGTDRAGRPYVYPILDWRNPVKTSAMALGGLLFVLTVHWAIWLLYLLRTRLHHRRGKKEIIFLEEVRLSVPIDTVA